jgi:hypothetical protein
MAVAPFMDRRLPTSAKSQIGFCQFIVQPLFEAVSAVLPALEAKLEHVENTLHFLNLWQEHGPLPAADEVGLPAWPPCAAPPAEPAAEPPPTPPPSLRPDLPEIYWDAARAALTTRVPPFSVSVATLHDSHAALTTRVPPFSVSVATLHDSHGGLGALGQPVPLPPGASPPVSGPAKGLRGRAPAAAAAAAAAADGRSGHAARASRPAAAGARDASAPVSGRTSGAGSGAAELAGVPSEGRGRGSAGEAADGASPV